MPPSARTRHGEPVWAGQFSATEWEALKLSSTFGDFVMPCCPAPAVLKTSLYGLQFFAHPSGECTTAPETVWHQTGKAMVMAAVRSLGFSCQEEVTGGTGRMKWRADTCFHVGDRTVVIELQRSHQHLRDYLRRQERYLAAGVEAYWLVRDTNLQALAGAISQKRLKEEFGGTLPPGSFYPALPSLPWALLNTGDEPDVRGPKLIVSVASWVKALVERRYRYSLTDGCWTID